MHIDRHTHSLLAQEAPVAIEDDEVLNTFTVPLDLRQRELQALELVGRIRLAAASQSALTVRAAIERCAGGPITFTA